MRLFKIAFLALTALASGFLLPLWIGKLLLYLKML